MRAATFKVVSVLDPALDTAGRITVEDMIKYTDTRDYALVDGKWMPGEKPTIYHVREVPHGLWESFVMQGTNDAERAALAFRAGVFKVENLYGEDGVSVGNWEPAKTAGAKFVLMSDEESQRFSPAERAEIGAVVYQHSFLARRIACTFPLPSTVREALARRRFLLVDKSPSSAEATSSEKPSEDSVPQTAVTAITTESSAAVSG